MSVEEIKDWVENGTMAPSLRAGLRVLLAERVERSNADFLTRIRAVETLWEGAEAVIASQAQELVEVVDKLAQAEQRVADLQQQIDFLHDQMQARESRAALPESHEHT